MKRLLLALMISLAAAPVSAEPIFAESSAKQDLKFAAVMTCGIAGAVLIAPAYMTGQILLAPLKLFKKKRLTSEQLHDESLRLQQDANQLEKKYLDAKTEEEINTLDEWKIELLIRQKDLGEQRTKLLIGE